MCNYHDNYINLERVRDAYSQLTHTFTNTKKNPIYKQIRAVPKPFLILPIYKEWYFLISREGTKCATIMKTI
jgi:hypothetical protein